MPESVIASRQRELFALYTAITTRGPAAPQRSTTPASPPVALSDDDAELLELGKQRLGPTFGRLLQGDRSDYGDASDADSGAMKDVLRLTGMDADRTERILRGLPLKRDKWDTRRGEKTWLRYSIDRALERGVEPLDSSTWTEHKADPANLAGPLNGSCSPHCTRHLQVIETQKKIIAELRTELQHAQTADTANGKRLGHLKRFRQTSTFSGKRKDTIEAIGFVVERARQLGKSEEPLYYGDRTEHKEGRDPGGLAGAAGTSPQTVGTAVDLLRAARATNPDAVPWRFITYQDDRGFPRVKVAFDPDSTLERDLARLAALPKAETVRKEPLRCPDCPTAKLHVSKSCTRCGQVVAEYTETPPQPKTLVQTLDKDSAPSAPSVDSVTQMSEFWTRDPLSKAATRPRAGPSIDPERLAVATATVVSDEDIPEWVKHGDWATRARWERQQWSAAGGDG
jgi:hypothetical protein